MLCTICPNLTFNVRGLNLDHRDLKRRLLWIKDSTWKYIIP